MRTELEIAYSAIDRLESQLTQARADLAEARRLVQFSLAEHIQRQREWSDRTYGPGPRSSGIIDHIQKELAEIAESPADVSEWIDVIILAIDGAAREGHSPEKIVNALVAKQTKNESRVWPDWRTVDTNKAICHIAPPTEAAHTSGYIAAPFAPWWDESKTGPAPSCERCGALMVRGREALITSPHGSVIGHREADKGWECMSCGNYKADAEAAHD